MTIEAGHVIFQINFQVKDGKRNKLTRQMQLTFDWPHRCLERRDYWQGK